MSARVDVAVLGGGFSGLAAAWRLAKLGYRSAVLEKDDELGGLARCLQVDGHSVERYYHHYFTTDDDVLALAAEIGLAGRLVWRPVRQALLYQGRALPLSTPLDLLSLAAIPLRQRIRLGLISQGLLGDGDLDRTSAEEWVRRHAGDETYVRLFRPLIRAKFGCDGGAISAAFIRGRLAARGASRGAMRWRERLGYLDGGSDVLAAGLRVRLGAAGAEVATGAEVVGLEPGRDGWRVAARVGGADEEIEARQVVCSLPTPVLRRITRGLDGTSIELLDGIEYRAVVVLALGLESPLGDVYWTTVVDPDRPFHALIEHTNLHLPASYGGTHVVYLGRYLDPGVPVMTWSDAEVHRRFLGALDELHPGIAARVRWSRVSRDRHATPVFRTGYGERVRKLEQLAPGLHLAGTLRVYPDSRNVNSALRIGRRIAETIAASMAGGRS